MNKLELIITRAWQQEAPWLSVLAPLSVIYEAVSVANKSLYDKAFFKKYHAPVPVLVIGNITVGGSGKTPLIIALVQYLQQKNVAVAVISRGYGRQADDPKIPILVTKDSTPKDMGDEPCLIVQSTNVPMAVGSDRGRAIELLLKNYPNLALIISDDGLQHHALHRDAEWIVVDGERGFGNGKIFPQGFLREPVSRLDGATVIYHDKQANRYPPDTLLMHLAPQKIQPLMDKAIDFKGKKEIYAVSGIGYPTRFFKTLTELGFKVVERPFADHHDFTLADLTPLDDRPIITTAKDAVKLRQLAKSSPHVIFENIWVLPVGAVLSPSVYQEMDKLLIALKI